MTFGLYEVIFFISIVGQKHHNLTKLFKKSNTVWNISKNKSFQPGGREPHKASQDESRGSVEDFGGRKARKARFTFTKQCCYFAFVLKVHMQKWLGTTESMSSLGRMITFQELEIELKGGSVSQSVGPPLLSRLKYPKSNGMDCHEILYIDSWSPDVS